MHETYIPDWVKGNGKIDEVLFAQEFLANHRLQFTEGSFFTQEGRIDDPGILKKEIYEEISLYITCGAARRVDAILATIALEARKENLTLPETVIHVANGTYHLIDGFSPEKEICRHRLPVHFDDRWPEPQLWLSFLRELLEPEDIDTLQEYMGYCLTPQTNAQKMLLIVGSGGEGKSRIGVVMKALLGDNMVNGSIAKLELSPFARADLEHRLLMVDDDLRMEALPQTNHIKTIISADCPLDLERKGVQSYQGRIYARLMAFGNETLQSLYDHSHGFYRRQLILMAKPRDPSRPDDPYLGNKLTEERDAIFHWALQGLFRLMGNDFRFTISQRSRELMQRNVEKGNNVLSFLQSEGYFRFDSAGSASSRALYSRYREWCEDNALNPLSSRSFSQTLEMHPGLGLRYTTHVPIGNGKMARGYRGIRLCPL